MPELPEVETTCRGLAPVIQGRAVVSCQVRERRLRWPVASGLEASIEGQRILSVARRAKYLLMNLERGTLIWHLGMSGSLRIATAGEALRKHDHVSLLLEGGVTVRFHDPRRFGSLHWTDEPPEAHWLIANLGVEPLDPRFDGRFLAQRLAGRRAAIKTAIMDARLVVGVGNIYASESLHIAGIHPARAAGRVSSARLVTLAESIRGVLRRAITEGGTTLRDFVNGNGQPGYFAQQLLVYGRAEQPCHGCGHPIKSKVIGQRATFYCGRCQH